MIYVEVNNTLYPAKIDEKTSDSKWDGRASMAITVGMTYADAAQEFVDDVEWSIINKRNPYKDDAGETVTPDPIKRDCSEFSVAGSITDHRDGTVTVKMGKPTQVEVDQELLAVASMEIDNLQNQLANAVTGEELSAAYTEGVNSL